MINKVDEINKSLKSFTTKMLEATYGDYFPQQFTITDQEFEEDFKELRETIKEEKNSKTAPGQKIQTLEFGHRHNQLQAPDET